MKYGDRQNCPQFPHPPLFQLRLLKILFHTVLKSPDWFSSSNVGATVSVVIGSSLFPRRSVFAATLRSFFQNRRISSDIAMAVQFLTFQNPDSLFDLSLRPAVSEITFGL